MATKATPKEKVSKSKPKETKPKDEGTSIFVYLDNIFLKRLTPEYDEKIAPGYYTSVMLSHDTQLLGIVNRVNLSYKIYNIPGEMVYKYFWHKVPKGRRFIKWVKKTKASKEDDALIEQIKLEQNCSKKEALQLFELYKLKGAKDGIK